MFTDSGHLRTTLVGPPYDEKAERPLSGIVLDAAKTMSDPADLINRAIEALRSAAIDLPEFSTLDRLVSRLRSDIHGRMMPRRIRRTQAAAKERLDALHDEHRGIEETLIGICGRILETEQVLDTDAAFGCQVRKLLSEQGGLADLAGQFETVSAWHRGNDLPLLWPIHAKYRVLLFRLLDLVDVRTATQDRSLLNALGVVSRHRHARRDEVLEDVDLGFASQRWQSFVTKRQFKSATSDRRALEVRVFVYLADALFTGDVDWDLIATHARDMIQVVLSIQAGRVRPSVLLRKLSTYNRRSLLYRAFRELSRVERTLFLLRYISNTEVRRIIRADTTKIETYKQFLDWISFCGPVIKSGDPVEQEKQLKYASLVANAIMLSNVADMTKVLSGMAADGHAVMPELVACASPYIRGHILRFGQYALDMGDMPPLLDLQPLPFEIV